MYMDCVVPGPYSSCSPQFELPVPLCRRRLDIMEDYGTRLRNAARRSSEVLPGLLCGMLFSLLLIRSTFHAPAAPAPLTGPSGRPVRRLQQQPLEDITPPEAMGASPGPASNTSSRVRITVAGKFRHTFSLLGHVFGESGAAVQLEDKATSSILKNLSPRIEKEAAKSFVDPAGDQLFYALAPAMQFFHGRIHLTCRIWLNKERYVAEFFTKNNMKRTLNDLQDNWLYMETLDTSLEPLTYGQVLGIPLDKQLEMSDGTLEPRMFQLTDRLFVTFNANIMYPGMGHLDTTFLYDLQRHDVFIPNVTGLTPSARQDSEWFPTDKAWMALTHNGSLYFIHNLDPLWVMKCDLRAKCEWVFKQKSRNRFLYESAPYVGSLRGGSPFEHYSGDYYISVAHNTLRKGSSYKRFYTTHLVLLYARPPHTFRVAFLSADLAFHPKLLASVPMQPTKEDDMDESFLFPVSLLLESRDSLVVGAHMNDVAAVVLRVQGVARILERAIAADQRLGTHRAAPPIRFLHAHLRDMYAQHARMWFV